MFCSGLRVLLQIVFIALFAIFAIYVLGTLPLVLLSVCLLVSVGVEGLTWVGCGCQKVVDVVGSEGTAEVCCVLP